MYRATDGVGRNVREVQGLGKDALASECAIAVHEQRKELFAPPFPGPILLGASAADGHGVDSFQVTGIRNQMNVDFCASACGVFAGCAHVIFHIAASQNAARIHVFKSGKDFLRSAPRDVHHHIQASAMAHSHHQFDRSILSGGVENFIHERNQRGDTLQ